MKLLFLPVLIFALTTLPRKTQKFALYKIFLVLVIGRNVAECMSYNNEQSNVCIRIEKHLQCEKLLGLAGGNTKKHGNKKSGESITPIRYNVIHTHIFVRRFSLIISLVVFHAIWWFSKRLANPSNLSHWR